MPTSKLIAACVFCAAAAAMQVSAGPGRAQAPTTAPAAEGGTTLDSAEQHALCARTLSVAAEQSEASGRPEQAQTYHQLAAQDAERALTGGADARMFGDAARDAVSRQLQQDTLDFLAVLKMCLERHGMTLQRAAEKERFPDWPQAPREGYTLNPEDLTLEPR